MKKLAQVSLLLCLMVLFVGLTAEAAFPTEQFSKYLSYTAPTVILTTYDTQLIHCELLKIQISVDPSFKNKSLVVALTDGRNVYPISTIQNPVVGTVYTLYKDISALPLGKYSIVANVTPIYALDPTFRVFGQVTYMMYI